MDHGVSFGCKLLLNQSCLVLFLKIKKGPYITSCLVVQKIKISKWKWERVIVM